MNKLNILVKGFIHSSKNLYKQEDKKTNANEQNTISEELE